MKKTFLTSDKKVSLKLVCEMSANGLNGFLIQCDEMSSNAVTITFTSVCRLEENNVKIQMARLELPTVRALLTFGSDDVIGC